MTKLLRSAFFAAMLVCGSAQALIIDAGNNPVGLSINQSPGPAGGSFSDTVNFTLTGPGGLVTTAFSNWPVATAGLRNLSFQLFQDSNLIASTGTSTVSFPGAPSFVFTNQFLVAPTLAGGDYRLVLSGDIRPDGGFYQWDVNTVAVPEPEQWALLIAGLALVAGVAKRRRKAMAA